jgi:hypothetical protein
MIKLVDLLKETPSHEVKNPNYFQQLLDMNRYSPSQRKFLQGVIDSVKRQNNLATEKQLDILQRIKTGDFNWGKK